VLELSDVEVNVALVLEVTVVVTLVVDDAVDEVRPSHLSSQKSYASSAASS